MSLGTIAHLQHYFARTGLLDGKGAQLAKEDPQGSRAGSRSVSGTSQTSPLSPLSPPLESLMNGASSLSIPDRNSYDESSIVSSPEQSPFDEGWESPHALDLPPTVSTYKKKSTYIPPPPNLSVLRRELREALEDARKLLQDVENDAKERGIDAFPSPSKSSDASNLQGWFEIQGLQVLDLVTLAIRAAKNFYTSHEQPQRLYAARTERQIRTELFTVLEVLKKLANRNFAGGVRVHERTQITKWITSIDDLVNKDEDAEKLEHEKMQKHDWQDSGWDGREREREWLFLKSFDPSPDTLPRWTALASDDSQPTAFLKSLQDGRRLVQLHNELVRRSKRQFETIKVYHTDVGKPYRCAENLRYWIKAAVLRWDAVLQVDVPGVVRGDSATAWQGFDAALMKWSSCVREAITREWQDHHAALKRERPVVRMDPGNEAPLPW